MNIIVLELILVAGVALGLGFWQLYDVNKELKKDREKNRAESTADTDSPAEATNQVADMGSQGSRQPDARHSPSGPGQDGAQGQ